MKLFFDDEGFDGQLQRAFAKSDAGAANVGECLYIASQITPGDRDSWYAGGRRGPLRGTEPGRVWTAAFDWLDETLS